MQQLGEPEPAGHGRGDAIAISYPQRRETARRNLSPRVKLGVADGRPVADQRGPAGMGACATAQPVVQSPHRRHRRAAAAPLEAPPRLTAAGRRADESARSPHRFSLMLFVVALVLPDVEVKVSVMRICPSLRFLTCL